VDFDDTPTEAAFRREVRSWLDAHAPRRGADEDFSGGFFDPDVDTVALFAANAEWQRTLFEHGWAGITYPPAYGGRGGTPLHELIYQQEAAAYGVHAGAYAVAHTMVGPAILEHGTEDQRRRFIEPMLRGDEVWCQLFSEPGSGSDLASLATRAVRDGDEWVVNGQKVWTSSAQHSQWGILLARTDPDAPRHRGITYFLLDMASPGVEIRPLRQMTGEAHFSEVFLTDVRVPAVNVLGGEGGVGQGWRAAMHTLTNERAMIGSAHPMEDYLALEGIARRAGTTNDVNVRQVLSDAYLRSQILRFFGFRMQTALSKGEMPGPEVSVVKLFFSDHVARSSGAALALQGPTGMLRGDGASAFALQRFLYSPSLTIAGGTSEVQRNIIGERVLGLAAEPKVAAGARPEVRSAPEPAQ
jgi:acyl-CoA dehydrogenase